MGNGFLEAVELRPQADRGLQFAAAAVVPAVLAAWALADVAAAPRPLGAVPLALAAVSLAGFLAGRRDRQPERATLLPDGSWRLVADGGRTLPARLHRAWGASGGPVIALEWACADGVRRRAWLLRRDVPGPGWRRLRARLRIA